MTVKSLLALALALFCSSFANANILMQDKATIDTFFKQYQILKTEGFDKFAKERSMLFSDNSVTLITNQTHTQYKGRLGHIQSVKDWMEQYRSIDDFSYQIVGETEKGVVEVKLFKQGTPTASNIHNWTEYFTFDQAGKIVKLQIDMKNFLTGETN